MKFTPKEIRLLLYIVLIYAVIGVLHIANHDRAIAPVGFPMLLVATIWLFQIPWKLADRFVFAAKRIQ